jgi:hypothetical protein
VILIFGIINYIMSQPDSLEQHLYDLILELCTVLYAHGYREVPMGAMMRMIGVNDTHAAEHDGAVFYLDEDFERVLEERQSAGPIMSDEPRPPDATLH